MSPEMKLPKRKGAASEEATPRRTGPGESDYSDESASRAALALDTRASLLHAVEKPAMEMAIGGAVRRGSSPSTWSSVFGVSSRPEISLLLMNSHCNEKDCDIGAIS